MRLIHRLIKEKHGAILQFPKRLWSESFPRHHRCGPLSLIVLLREAGRRREEALLEWLSRGEGRRRRPLALRCRDKRLLFRTQKDFKCKVGHRPAIWPALPGIASFPSTKWKPQKKMRERGGTASPLCWAQRAIFYCLQKRFEMKTCLLTFGPASIKGPFCFLKGKMNLPPTSPGAKFGVQEHWRGKPQVGMHLLQASPQKEGMTGRQGIWEVGRNAKDLVGNGPE